MSLDCMNEASRTTGVIYYLSFVPQDGVWGTCFFAVFSGFMILLSGICLFFILSRFMGICLIRSKLQIRMLRDYDIQCYIGTHLSLQRSTKYAPGMSLSCETRAVVYYLYVGPLIVVPSIFIESLMQALFYYQPTIHYHHHERAHLPSAT